MGSVSGCAVSRQIEVAVSERWQADVGVAVIPSFGGSVVNPVISEVPFSWSAKVRGL
ncbi:hypothetical protein E2C01_096626 [Portunus trituberculatus]|uniref:Uncharacterized protein n=1 Tax=Portunus trituberculatus TaxID=210409 RepID=A0A5B7JYE8_PORTR|nr:hypothetical protein [Portunus trituberculatus]